MQQTVQLTAEKEQVVAEKAVVEAEKEAVTTELNSAVSAVRGIFVGRNDDLLIELLSLMEPWDANAAYLRGDVRKHNNVPYTAIQPNTPAGDLNYAPDKAPALWQNYHAKAAKYALPYVAPSHAEDIYRKDEYMVWTDNAIYKALADTDRAPDVLPDRWQKVDANGNPITTPPPENPPPTGELNSNGTVKWSLWVDPAGDNTKLYGTGDGVTDSTGQRWTSNYPNNGNSPADGWWTKA